jgi:hypothetical protein
VRGWAISVKVTYVSRHDARQPGSAVQAGLRRPGILVRGGTSWNTPPISFHLANNSSSPVALPIQRIGRRSDNPIPPVKRRSRQLEQTGPATWTYRRSRRGGSFRTTGGAVRGSQGTRTLDGGISRSAASLAFSLHFQLARCACWTVLDGRP